MSIDRKTTVYRLEAGKIAFIENTCKASAPTPWLWSKFSAYFLYPFSLLCSTFFTNLDTSICTRNGRYQKHMPPPPLPYRNSVTLQHVLMTFLTILQWVVTEICCTKVSTNWKQFLSSLSIVCMMPTLSYSTCTGSTTMNKAPHNDWRVKWQTEILLHPSTVVGLVAFEYEDGFRSDLKAPNLKNGSWVNMPPGPLYCIIIHAYPASAFSDYPRAYHNIWYLTL